MKNKDWIAPFSPSQIVVYYITYDWLLSFLIMTTCAHVAKLKDNQLLEQIRIITSQIITPSSPSPGHKELKVYCHILEYVQSPVPKVTGSSSSFKCHFNVQLRYKTWTTLDVITFKWLYKCNLSTIFVSMTLISVKYA